LNTVHVTQEEIHRCPLLLVIKTSSAGSTPMLSSAAASAARPDAV
jgi:hypothetical protein